MADLPEESINGPFKIFDMFKSERSGKCEPIIFIFDAVMVHQQTQFLNLPRREGEALRCFRARSPLARELCLGLVPPILWDVPKLPALKFREGTELFSSRLPARTEEVRRSRAVRPSLSDARPTRAGFKIFSGWPLQVSDFRCLLAIHRRRDRCSDRVGSSAKGVRLEVRVFCCGLRLRMSEQAADNWQAH